MLSAVKALLTLGAFVMYLHGLLASLVIAGCTEWESCLACKPFLSSNVAFEDLVF